MYINDGWKYAKAQILELYLNGKTPGSISGVTGVPRIRIEHELQKAADKHPELLSRHMAARYPSQRRRAADVDPRLLLEA